MTLHVNPQEQQLIPQVTPDVIVCVTCGAEEKCFALEASERGPYCKPCIKRMIKAALR